MTQPSPVQDQPYFRTTLSLPADQAQLLNQVAKTLGCSQSLLVSVILADTLPALEMGAVSLLGRAAEPPRRAGGPYVDAIAETVAACIDEGRFILRQGSLL